MPSTGWLMNNKHWLLTALEAEVQDQGADTFVFWFIDGCVFQLCPHMADK